MGWRKTRKGWVHTSKDDNKTLGGIPKETNRKTNEKIKEHTRWWNLTPLQRARELENKDQKGGS